MVAASCRRRRGLLAERWPDSRRDRGRYGRLRKRLRIPAGAAGILAFRADHRCRVPGQGRSGARAGQLVRQQHPAGSRAGARAAWRLSLRLRPPRGLSNPGRLRLRALAFRPAYRGDRLGPRVRRQRPPSGQHVGLSTRRAGARRLRGASAAALDGREAAPYVLGLAIGAYQALPEAEWDKLRRTGTIHLISISGFHIALVAGPAALLGLGSRAGTAGGGLPLPAPGPGGLDGAARRLRSTGRWRGSACPRPARWSRSVIVAVLATWRRAVTVPELLASVVLGVLLVEPLAPLVPGILAVLCRRAGARGGGAWHCRTGSCAARRRSGCCWSRSSQ